MAIATALIGVLSTAKGAAADEPGGAQGIDEEPAKKGLRALVPDHEKALLLALVMRLLDETAGRLLMGSFPAVEEHLEAVELVEGQAGNPDLDLETMPLQHEMLAVHVDEGGALVSDVEPIPFEELPPSEARRLETSGLPVLTEEDLAGPLEGAGEDDSPDAGEQAHTREPAPQG